MTQPARLDRLPLSRSHHERLLIGGLGFLFAAIAAGLPDLEKENR